MKTRLSVLAIGVLVFSGNVLNAAGPRIRKAAATAPTYTLQRVIDTDTAIPNGTGNFDGFHVPLIHNGQLAFGGYVGQPDNAVGVYRRTPGGPLEVIADRQTSAPDGGPLFAGFLSPVIDNGDVVFGGRFLVNGDVEYQGLYRHRDGALSRLVDLETAVEDSNTQFSRFYSYDYSDGELAFVAGGTRDDEFSDGLYRRSDAGAVTVIADDAMVVPDAPPALFWLIQSNPAYMGSKVAFSADFNFQVAPMSGVFLADGDDIATIYESGYSFYRDLSGSPTQLSFCLYDSAVFLYRDGVVTRPVSAGRNRLPDRPLLPVNRIGAAAVAGDALAYTGTFQISFTIPVLGIPLLIEIPIHSGLYADFGNGWETAVAMGDVVDGGRVRGIAFGPRSFDGNQLCFRLDFADGSQAIYVATREE
jgi:hypothetical protein